MLFIFALATLYPEAHPIRLGMSSWNQWDTGWYLRISAEGYFSEQSAAFSPLYPLLIAGGTALAGAGNRLLVALIISNVATLVGLIGVARYAAFEEGGSDAPSRALRILLTYPFAIFLAAAYSEGLFLALAAWSLLLARRGRWLPAATLAFFCGLTRPTAVILVVPLLWEFGRQNAWRIGVRHLPRLALLAGAVPLAYALIGVYMAFHFGDFFAAAHAQGHWYRQLEAPPYTLWLVFDHLQRLHNWAALWNLVPFVVLGAVTAIEIRRAPFSATIFMVGLLLISIIDPRPTRADVIESTGRFLCVAFPAFVAIGRWTQARPWLDFAWTMSGSILQALLLLAFLDGRGVH